MSEKKLVLGGFVTCRPAPILFDYGKPVGLSLLSDLHIGAPHVDYKLIKEEIQQAVDHEDRILINGDVLDLILCKDMKRFSPDCLHPRLQGKRNVLNQAVNWAVELLKPAAHLIDMIGFGNHESAVEKWHGFDPIAVIVEKLQSGLHPVHAGHVIHYGGFTGFVDYRLRHPPVEQRHGTRFVIYYHHGAGHNAPVTKGLIDFNRCDTFVDADMIWLGHKHNRLHVAVQKLSCALSGDDPRVKDVRHVMTGAYFKTYVGQSQESVRKHGRRSNYAADACMPPQGTGGARVELTVRQSQGKTDLLNIRVSQ
jgi:hypothetical protein